MAVETDMHKRARIYLDSSKHWLEEMNRIDTLILEGRPHPEMSDLVWARTIHRIEQLCRWYIQGELGTGEEEELMALLVEYARSMGAVRRLSLAPIKLPPEDEPERIEPAGRAIARTPRVRRD